MTNVRDSLSGNSALWIILTILLGGGGTTFGIVQTTAANDAHRTSVANIESLRDELRERDEKLQDRLEKNIGALSVKVNDLTTEVAKLKGTVEALTTRRR